MPTGSVEGLILSLLFVVPGGFGVDLRRSIVPASAPSPFRELLHALGTSGAAIIVMELMFGLAGAFGQNVGMGDAIVGPVLAAKEAPVSTFPWGNYLGYLVLALSLPLLAAGIRRSKPLKQIFRGVSLHSTGLDELFAEIWPGLPASGGTPAPWVVVETSDGRLVQGQMLWRSTAPHPVELILGDTCDVTDPSDEKQGERWLWIPTSSIGGIRVQPPPETPSTGENEVNRSLRPT